MNYRQIWMENLDLQKNGFSQMIEENIRRNRTNSVRITVKDKEGNPVPGAKINVKQIGHEFKFGCNAFMANGFESSENNEKYERIFREVFNQAVIPFYWRDDEPEPGKWRFEKDSPFIYRRQPAEIMLDFCRRTGAEPKGHNLIWHHRDTGMPTWWPENDKPLCQRLIDNRIKLLASRYADKIPSWDVTNELIAAPGRERMPYDFELKAWKLATEVFPYNHLIINDYKCFFDEFHREASALYQQVLRISEAGARIDGIGMQYHLFKKKEELESCRRTNLSASHMMNMMDVYSQLNRAIHVSEITVPSYEGSPEILEAQAEITEALYKIWFSMENVRSIVWWNLVDGHAYVNSTWDEACYNGGLFTHDFTPKPAFEVINRLINREWRTEVSGVTDSGGNMEVRGYHGDYKVTIDDNGKIYEKPLKITKTSRLLKIEI